MKKDKEFDKVEWFDEHAIGHSTAYEDEAGVWVEIGISGTVLLDGVEYIVEDAVIVRAHQSKM